MGADEILMKLAEMLPGKVSEGKIVSVRTEELVLLLGEEGMELFSEIAYISPIAKPATYFFEMANENCFGFLCEDDIRFICDWVLDQTGELLWYDCLVSAPRTQNPSSVKIPAG